MEENNRKGPGVFYAVVGVATLVVAIIGATFAYFSASTSGNSSVIQGNSLNITESDLQLTVSRVLFTGATVDTNLAPAFIGSGNANPEALTEQQLQALLTAKCEEANKYTGCHVWKVDAHNASTTDAIQHANLWLNLTVTPTRETGGDTSQWGYAVFQATETETKEMGTPATYALSNAAYATVPSGEGLRANHDDLATPVTGKTLDMHNDDTIAANGHAIYYVMVYLNDDNLVQNATTPSNESPTSTDARASYTGSVLFEAMGGKVRATFTAA